MLCSFCNLAFHPRCLVPPLEKVPKQEWACPTCAKQFRRRKKRYNNVDSVKEENERMKRKLEQLNAKKRKREEKEREVEERKRRRRREEKNRREKERRDKEAVERKRRDAEEEERRRMNPGIQDEAQEWCVLYIFLLQKNCLCSQTHRYDRNGSSNPKYFEETKFPAFDPRAENDGVANPIGCRSRNGGTTFRLISQSE